MAYCACIRRSTLIEWWTPILECLERNLVLPYYHLLRKEIILMCWNCEMMEKISIQFMRLDYFSNMCACTRLTRLQLYKTKYILRIAVTRSNPVPDIILSLPKWDEDQDNILISGVSTGEK